MQRIYVHLPLFHYGKPLKVTISGLLPLSVQVNGADSAVRLRCNYLGKPLSLVW